jgi:hypothetical protein
MFGILDVWILHADGIRGALTWLVGFIGPMLGAAGYGFLSPLPWQWSGDDRSMVGFARGMMQSLLFAFAFFLLLHLASSAIVLALLRPDRLSRWGQISLFPYLFQTPFMVLVGLFISMGERSDLDKRRAESRLKEAQWILLRAQLSPHVLFNTLNALAELARRDPEATEKALLDLSELYERMLHHGDRLLAPLSEERKVLERYLNVQALRLGARLQVEWDWDSGLDALQVPPLLLQPLVENALKHGIAPQAGLGTLRISGKRDAGRARLEVRNTGRTPGSPRAEGTGLRNLKERLHLAYGGKAGFDLVREGDWTVAHLDLPEEPWTR